MCCVVFRQFYVSLVILVVFCCCVLTSVCVFFCVFLCGSRSFWCLFFCRIVCCVMRLNDVVSCFVCLSVRSGFPSCHVCLGFPGMAVVDVVDVCRSFLPQGQSVDAVW